MKKRVFLVALLVLAVGVGTSFAQVRFDLSVDYPFGMGMVFSSYGMGDGSPQASFTNIAQYFMFPEFSVHYQFGDGAFKAGIGARFFTLVLESIGWPNAFVELSLGKISVTAQFGGGYFLLFGLFSTTGSGAVFFPDLSVRYQISDTFSMGLGALAVYLPDVLSSLGTTAFPMVIYANARFTFY